MKRKGDLDATRRQMLALGLIATGGTAASALASGSVADQRAPKGIEGQRRADLGGGRYLNPVLSGDRSDPNILKDGEDYYATFSSFLYYPGIIIWHSRDLVNWVPVGPALTKPIGSIFALDIAKHDGRYFIYVPTFVPPTGPPKGAPFKIYAIHATDMRGPWSDPVDMGIDGYIDPGHAVGEDGKRYLFLNNGNRVRISDDGLSRSGPVEKIYDGWEYPQDWIVEGFALEGPKILRKDGWFYMFSGEGGTAGPPTSHMVVVARSRSIHGPWENGPRNPVVRTAHRDEPWWSRGHATPVQGPLGDWWLVYHGYENGFRTLGRQMLLEPMKWTADGWPRATGGDLSKPLPKPRGTLPGPHGIALSGDFTGEALGSRLQFYAPEPGYLDRVKFKDGALTLAGKGTGPATSSPLAMITGDRSYDVSVALTLDGDVQGGLLLFYDEDLFCGLGLGGGKLQPYSLGKGLFFPPAAAQSARTLHLRVVNDENVASFYYSLDGARWTKESSFEVSGYNHNMGDGFVSLRPALFASGTGSVRFCDLRHAAR